VLAFVADDQSLDSVRLKGPQPLSRALAISYQCLELIKRLGAQPDNTWFFAKISLAAMLASVAGVARKVNRKFPVPSN
jgi:hypothetical protein